MVAMNNSSLSLTLSFEFALSHTHVVEGGTTITVPSEKIFIDIIAEVLLDRGFEFKPEELSIYVNRAPTTPFFPIAANEQQIKNFQHSLQNPSHRKIPASDWNLSVDIIEKKYKCTVFTIYHK